MVVREAVEAEVRKLAIHSVTVLGRYSALRPSTSPGFVSPTALVHFVRNLRDGAHRHKLTEQVPTGVFPQLAWQPAAAARSALLIHAPTDATAALVRRAKHCQQTWPDALSQRPTSTDSILSRNVDERTASESLSNTQRPLDLHQPHPLPAPPPSPTPNVRLACLELSRFRRLPQPQVKIDKKTTILVGANNSGKTRTATSTRRCRLPWRRSQPRRRWTYSPWCRSSSKSARVPRPALFLLQPPRMLFLDTEFRCAADDGELLSIGIVGDSCEFYAELDEDGVASVLRGHRRNRFLQQAVLPQFGRVPGARHTLDGMAQAAARWLASRDGDALKVAYDYSMDFSLLERLLANSYGSVLARLVPVHVGYLLDDPLGKEAAVASWSATRSATDKLRGLRRHHASCRCLGVEGALRGRTWRVTWGAGMASSVAVSKTSAADNAPPKQSGRASSTPDE